MDNQHPGTPGSDERLKQDVDAHQAAGNPPADQAAVIPEPPAPPPRPPLSQRIKRLWHGLKESFVRVYAMALVVVLLWAGYAATMSLVRTVFFPQPVPKRFLEWQARVDAAALRSADVPGVTGPAARAPIGHYHGIERWFQVDPQNGCTPSGCHDPLPHTKDAKIPAFANFHATFLSCQMCHSPADASAHPVWISTTTGHRREPPALLQLLKYVETSDERIHGDPASAHSTIVRHLREAVAVAGEDRQLTDLLLQFETTEPGSPVWKRAVDRLADELPQHARGEYGAKIVREANDGSFRRDAQAMLRLAKLPLGDAQRRDVHQDGAGKLLNEPVGCVSCHTDQSTFDFDRMGYSQKRAKLLQRLELAKLMQRIREGERFFIPRLIGGSQNGNGNP